MLLVAFWCLVSIRCVRSVIQQELSGTRFRTWNAAALCLHMWNMERLFSVSFMKQPRGGHRRASLSSNGDGVHRRESAAEANRAAGGVQLSKSSSSRPI
jgi:hypothetical protein